MNKESKQIIKQNNAGFTLVEMVIAFALLALFMVAVTRVISYTVMLYHTTQASANGYEISGILSNKIIGMVENAAEVNITDASGTCLTGEGHLAGNGIQIEDRTGTKTTILRTNADGSGNSIIDMQYEQSTTKADGTPITNTGVWRYDENVYMGFSVSELSFEKGMSGYPENVIKMSITLHNDKYGSKDYSTEYYMKYSEIKEPVAKSD